MTKYKVELTGNGRHAVVTVEANSKQKAIAAAQAKYGVPYQYPYALAWEVKTTW